MPTSNMSLVLPVEHGSSNVWDVILDTAFGLIDSHGHVTGQGVPIVTAALNINADLTFAGYSLLHGKLIGLDEQSSNAVSRSLWTKSSDHNLYWRNSSGVDVQITSGSTLNVSIVGGIGGDYASVGALLSYDDATRRYLLQQEGSPRPWAGLATADIDLYEKAASISNRVRLASPTALAASYALKFPAALPGDIEPLQCDASGNLAFSAVFSTTTVFQSGDFKNTVAVGFAIPAASWLPPAAGGGVATGASGGVKAVTLGTTNYYTIPVRLPVNATITAVFVSIFKHSSNATTLTAKLCTLDTTTGTETVQSTFTNNDNGTGYALMQATGLNVSVASTLECYIAINGGADALDLGYQAQVNYKRA